MSQLALGKGTSLPSARLAALGKDSTFASANGQHSAKDDGGATGVAKVFCRGLFFAECLTLGKEDVCRVSLFAECLTLGKDGLCRVLALPSAALSKLPLCRVPVFRHSAKRRALGKERVSRSVSAKFTTITSTRVPNAAT